MNYENLLIQYRSLWQNRQLTGSDRTPEEVLKMAIQRELLDENAHPRVRKSIYEKFYFAIKRINESNLKATDKDVLITIHITILDQIKSYNTDQ
ncbi:hypothetical protein [Cytobacillus gottheilii]|uniref:hypothetical protein n=1 Tax=Cytobacillus gottheilii TaxID=859144 RepID=UPI001593AE81|nr:hypothetical protein [Cytobacillus gottheilii]